MMASRLFPLAAVVATTSTVLPAAAFGAPATVATPAPGTGSEYRRSQSDLYDPAPTVNNPGLASSFYRAYGRSLEPLELKEGVRSGSLVTAPPAPAVAQARSGMGVGMSRGAVAWLGALVLLVAVAMSMVAAPAARAKLPDQFLGITTEDAYTGTDAYSQEQLAAQRAAGFTVARQVFRWNEVNPKRHDYDFSATDRFVRNAAISGMRVIPLLQGEPAWASSRPARNKSRYLYPPANVSSYAAFASAVARRYGPRGAFWKAHPELPARPVKSYQLWNEPNLPVYWAGKPNAKQYARLVVAAAKAIRKFDRKAYIISAGLPDSKLSQHPQRFVRTMLRSGARGYVDAIGIHPYARKPSQSLRIARQLRRAINQAGGRRLALWVTELGWAAGGPKTPTRTVSAARQGPTIVSAIRKLTSARRELRLKGIVYYAWRDSEVYAGGKDFWGLHTGLLDRRGDAKPSMRVVAQALRTLK